MGGIGGVEDGILEGGAWVRAFNGGSAESGIACRFGTHNFNSQQSTFATTKSEHNFGPSHTYCTVEIQ